MASISSTLKIVDETTLRGRRNQVAADGKVVVWTNGCFDLLHVGHIRVLQAARRFGDLLIVGINSDRSIRQLKGPDRPFMSELDRAEIVSALECVDYVIIFDELTPETMINQLRPDVHCKGADYAWPNGKPIPEARLVQSYGGRIEIIPLIPGTSTSNLVQRILRQRAQ